MTFLQALRRVFRSEEPTEDETSYLYREQSMPKYEVEQPPPIPAKWVSYGNLVHSVHYYVKESTGLVLYQVTGSNHWTAMVPGFTASAVYEKARELGRYATREQAKAAVEKQHAKDWPDWSQVRKPPGLEPPDDPEWAESSKKPPGRATTSTGKENK